MSAYVCLPRWLLYAALFIVSNDLNATVAADAVLINKKVHMIIIIIFLYSLRRCCWYNFLKDKCKVNKFISGTFPRRTEILLIIIY